MAHQMHLFQHKPKFPTVKCRPDINVHYGPTVLALNTVVHKNIVILARISPLITVRVTSPDNLRRMMILKRLQRFCPLTSLTEILRRKTCVQKLVKIDPSMGKLTLSHTNEHFSRYP